jgi:hypothetical protein
MGKLSPVFFDEFSHDGTQVDQTAMKKMFRARHYG